MDKQTLGLMLVIATVAFTGAFIGGKRPAVVERVVEKTLGASPGPERQDACESRNGVQQCFTRMTLKTATTTVCSIRSPVNATSTLVRGSITFRTSTTTTALVTMGRSALLNATTTLIGDPTLSGTGQLTIRATTTTAQLDDGLTISDPVLFPPGHWFNIGMSGGVSGTYSPTGTCQATFEVL